MYSVRLRLEIVTTCPSCPHSSFDPAQGRPFCALVGEIRERDAAFVCPEARFENPDVKKPLAGLGDVVKRVTDALGIPQCGGCKARQEALNRLVPFGGSPGMSEGPSKVPSGGAS